MTTKVCRFDPFGRFFGALCLDFLGNY